MSAIEWKWYYWLKLRDMGQDLPHTFTMPKNNLIRDLGPPSSEFRPGYSRFYNPETNEMTVVYGDRIQ